MVATGWHLFLGGLPLLAASFLTDDVPGAGLDASLTAVDWLNLTYVAVPLPPHPTPHTTHRKRPSGSCPFPPPKENSSRWVGATGVTEAGKAGVLMGPSTD